MAALRGGKKRNHAATSSERPIRAIATPAARLALTIGAFSSPKSPVMPGVSIGTGETAFTWASAVPACTRPSAKRRTSFVGLASATPKAPPRTAPEPRKNRRRGRSQSRSSMARSARPAAGNRYGSACALPHDRVERYRRPSCRRHHSQRLGAGRRCGPATLAARLRPLAGQGHSAFSAPAPSRLRTAYAIHGKRDRDGAMFPRDHRAKILRRSYIRPCPFGPPDLPPDPQRRARVPEGRKCSRPPSAGVPRTGGSRPTVAQRSETPGKVSHGRSVAARRARTRLPRFSGN